MEKAKKLILKVTPNCVYKAYKGKKDNRIVNIYKKKYSKLSIERSKKVSVVIPNYNYESFLQERIDSVLLQTYPIYELIILDDCSKDNSVSLIKKIIKEHPEVKMKLIENNKNSGSVFSQWQKGFMEAKGDYVWIAEADDSCNPKFLETLMKAFDDKDVVISYAESKRIDENNRIINDSCRDWMTAVSTTRWDEDYIHTGDQEIREALSVCNTIPNVSAVVFKKKNQVQIIEDAKKFKISGDWYIYYTLLKNGKVAYCSKSLNYFRKHNKSTSTVAKKELELEELLTIQKDIRDNYVLTSNQIHKQSYRYGNLIQEIDKKTITKLSKMMAKKIAWIIPHPIKGSGGIRTMIQNANFLVKCGYECDIYVEEDYINTSESMKEIIKNFYGECLCDVYVGIQLEKNYDLVFSTYSILTPDYLYYMPVPRKAYFIQDFEPWFEPMGGLYLEMERTYRYKFQGVSIGKWLTYKITNEFSSPMNYFDFCADTSVYKKLSKIKKENAVCFIFQPEKARRCSNIGIKALMLVKKLRPDVKIYLYGSDVHVPLQLEHENLHIIPIDKCNELYNKCKVGLCISSSNPSRIPFEMMAAGLPVVDLHRENNLYDIPEGGVLLADSSPEAVATAIIKILDDKKLQESMAVAGNKYMKDFPIEKGYEQFRKFVEDTLNDTVKPNTKVEKIYKKEPVYPSKEVLEVMDVIKPIPIARKNTSKKVRELVKKKRALRWKYACLVRKVFKI